MTTTANLAPGATPANGVEDPFTTAAAHTPLRYGAVDAEQLSLYTTNSPSQARRALEAHLKDTDRRIQDASRLGTTLLQQRKDLSARLDEVKQVQQDSDVPPELRKKLADLEKEYNEIGRESARAFLPKSRVSSTGEALGTPSAYTGSGRESPTKLTAPSRRQRNQPSNRVHDIEFATEISTSLLAQVRQLQTALAEKDESLKDTTSAKAQLETDLDNLAQKVKHLDENEQRYKDENWNLETRLQELEGTYKLSSDKEQRLAQSLKATQSEKSNAQRDLDDLKASHERLNEEHALAKRQHETDLYGLRRDATMYEAERQRLQKKVDELTSQNTELAKAVSYRWNQPSAATDSEFVSAEEDHHADDGTPENSEPASPVKGTPRHGMLESETLKSSLNHAHRMIQNLKNNMHREKTEKIELKRMLQDARDELEARRGETGGAANAAKKRNDAKFRKPAKPSALGASRNSTTEVFEDEPDWEDHDGQSTPSKSRDVAMGLTGAVAGAAGMAAFSSGDTDDFETATEREGTTTDSFETGREDMDDEDSDELTETETVANRSSVIRQRPSLAATKPGDRHSFLSTASISADDDEENDVLHTPPQNQQPKYKVKLNRGSKQSRVHDIVTESPSQYSPTSSTGTPQPAGQSLGDELDALDDASMEGTPSRFSESIDGTPLTARLRSVGPATPEQYDARQSAKRDTPGEAHTSVLIAKPSYADAGVMTEAWEPEAAALPAHEQSDIRDKAEGAAGGALAGFGLGWFSRKKATKEEAASDEDEQGPESAAELERPATALGATEGDDGAGNAAATQNLGFSPVLAQELEPKQGSPFIPSLPERSQKRNGFFYVPSDEGVTGYAIPGTDGAQPGAGFFGASEGDDKVSASRKPLSDIDPNAVSSLQSKENSSQPLHAKKPVADEGSQTMISGDEIDSLLRDKSKYSGVVITGFDSGPSPARPPTAIGPGSGRAIDAVAAADPLRTPRRPASSGSTRTKNAPSQPPLPEDHNLKIAAAQKTPGTPHAGPAAVGTMGPPAMPASAYKQHRPSTPSGRAVSRDGPPPRFGRGTRIPASPGSMSRRTSVSSFASELDERFNMHHGHLMYPDDIKPATDPRMIQAITQTMIGEYLWKYTRKAGRSETSSTRHRRFFWVHPYTRTLYWSEKDPSAAGRDMLKAKSVAIESVRVITDDNTYPPGLHRKSLVVVTPGREIVFTAPTGQRHETWFNALSYLLLRTENDHIDGDDGINQDDIDEFNPGFGTSVRRSLSRFTGRSQSRVSLSSYNSRTTRNSSPTRIVHDAPTLAPSLAQRQSAAPVRASQSTPEPGATVHQSSNRDSVSSRGRLSSITQRFRPSSSHRGRGTGRGRSSISGRGRPGDPSDIYDASVVDASAEDLRTVMARQEQDADRLENVRACCDGKHDVGSLARQGKHSSLSSRFSGHGGGAHTHSH